MFWCQKHLQKSGIGGLDPPNKSLVNDSGFVTTGFFSDLQTTSDLRSHWCWEIRGLNAWCDLGELFWKLIGYMKYASCVFFQHLSNGKKIHLSDMNREILIGS